MSIDVEDWFHVENLRRVVVPETWRRREFRLEHAMDRMLELMAEHDVQSTCFVLGWVAERAPRLVRRIADAGHEIASHGYHHDQLPLLKPGEFHTDIARSKAVLEEITGAAVRGYRAPNFSLTEWAIQVIRDVGFDYDSSFYPTTIRYGRYGSPAAFRSERTTVIRRDGFTEVSLPCLTVGDHALPWGGGAYFRLLPYPVFRWGVRRILAVGQPYVFYIHPWELDTGQPRVSGLRHTERMRHYFNLEKTERRWRLLLRDFEWTTIADVLAAERDDDGFDVPFHDARR